MYYVDINTVEQKYNIKPYETVVKICITDVLFERFIKLQLTDCPQLINMYYNPLLKFLGMSPILVTIDSTAKDSASLTKELSIDHEIKFHFAKKKHRSYFENIILNSIMNFFDKQVQLYEKNNWIYD